MAKTTNISTLNIRITADAKGMRQGLNKAQTQVKGFGSKAVAGFRAVGAAIGGVTILLGGLGIAAKKAASKILETAAAVDEVVKRARALGVEVKQLESFQLLAEFSGADAQKAGLALERLSISIGDATKESGEAFDAFTKLGLSIDDLNNQSVVDSVEDLGKALERFGGSRQEKLDILGALVGTRQAGNLINTIEAMANGLDEIDGLLADIGFTLTDVQSDNIEEMNDAILLAQRASSAFWRQLAAELAPTIEELALAAADFLATLQPWIPTIARIIEIMIDWFEIISPITWQFQRLYDVLVALGLLVERDIGKKFKDLQDPIDGVSDAIGRIPGKVDIGVGFKEQSTGGFDRRTQGGISQLNDAIRNRQKALRDEKSDAQKMADRDKRRDEILDEIARNTGRRPLDVKETVIVG